MSSTDSQLAVRQLREGLSAKDPHQRRALLEEIRADARRQETLLRALESEILLVANSQEPSDAPELMVRIAAADAIPRLQQHFRSKNAWVIGAIAEAIASLGDSAYDGLLQELWNSPGADHDFVAETLGGAQQVLRYRAALRSGIEAWSAVFKPFSAPMIYHDLRGIRFPGADMSGVWLWNSDLRSAILDRVSFRSASLDRSDLCGASLVGADLTGTTLKGVCLRGADLRDTIGLTPAQLSSAFLDQATKLPA